MSACSQCGTVVKPADKFCNVCGSPIGRPAAPPTPALAYPASTSPTYPSQGVAPAHGGNAGTSPAPARCQFGHEIGRGAGYCPLGHPIAIDPVQYGADAFGGAYANAGGSRPTEGYAPPPSYGSPAAAGVSYRAPPAQAAYASAYGAPVEPPRPAVSYSSAPPPAPLPPLPPSPSPAAFDAASHYNVAAGPAPAYAAEAPLRVLRGFLVAYGTNPSGEFWPLTAGHHTVGRFGTGDIVDIPLQDPTISSRHAALLVDAPNASVTVEDTGSTNGTFINDEHIGYGGRRELRDGDRLRFGGFTTIVKVIGRY